MAGRDRLALGLSIGWRKLLSTRVNGLALAGFLLFLGYLWARDSFSLSFGAFLYLHPFLSLIFSQDMVHDEIASGALENVLFAGGRFRHYLLSKSALTAVVGMGVSLAVFSGYVVYGVRTHQLAFADLGRFAAGILVGLYYVALAGALSFFFRAGSNVLFIILGQFVLVAGLLLSASQRMGLVERLTSSVAQGMGARLEFISLSFVIPNVTIARPSWLNLLGLTVGAVFLLAVQVWKAWSLELRQR
jgi:hypothetical protein